jgi:hypothetical protein
MLTLYILEVGIGYTPHIHVPSTGLALSIVKI